MQVLKITLHSGATGLDFVFEKHHSSNIEPYEALQMFEANNLDILGDTSYTLVSETGGVQTSKYIQENGLHTASNMLEMAINGGELPKLKTWKITSTLGTVGHYKGVNLPDALNSYAKLRGFSSFTEYVDAGNSMEATIERVYTENEKPA